MTIFKTFSHAHFSSERNSLIPSITSHLHSESQARIILYILYSVTMYLCACQDAACI